jgi:hypothetical protein
MATLIRMLILILILILLSASAGVVGKASPS